VSGTAPAGVIRAALLGRCPRCGQGPLFQGILAFRPKCPVCGLELQRYDSGDGPAFAGIVIVGTLAVIGALVVDARYAPPLWVHAVLWPTLVLPLSVWVMRVAKAALAWVQYRQQLAGGG
jgi:uncharacterized protein (DUF983 family)